MLLHLWIHVGPLGIAKASGHGQMIIFKAVEGLDAQLLFFSLSLLLLLLLLLEHLLLVVSQLAIATLLLVFLLRLFV